VNASLADQVGKLARRSVARTLRQPALIVPNLVFPLFLMFVVSAGAKEVTDIRGFPTDSYITFLFGATLVQAAAGGMTVAASGLGSDIETGFLESPRSDSSRRCSRSRWRWRPVRASAPASPAHSC
jgi:ABC-2 type transport system permease protein